MPNQLYVLYCYKMPTGSPHMYAMNIAVPWITGSVALRNYDNVADLQGSFNFLGLSSGQQAAAINVNEGEMYIQSGLSVPDNIAVNFGIQLHDGNFPNEANEITFTQCSQSGGALMVNVVMNEQIMPAPVVGCFDWNTVAACLLQSGVFTQAQIDAIKNEVQTNGTSTQDWRGVSTGILQCMK
jgi:hypothetical protein